MSTVEDQIARHAEVRRGYRLYLEQWVAAEVAALELLGDAQTGQAEAQVKIDAETMEIDRLTDLLPRPRPEPEHDPI